MNWDPVTHYKEVAVAERYDRERFSSLAGRVFNALERSCIRRIFRRVSKEATIMDLPRRQVVFSQSFNTPYQRFRRRIKGMLGNQAPAAYPISETELRKLLTGAGLKEVGRVRPLALLSEAIYVIAEPASHPAS